MGLRVVRESGARISAGQSIVRQLPMFLEFWLQASRDKKIWEASIAPYRRYHKYFTSLIKKGVKEGSFVDVDAEPPTIRRDA